MLEGERLPLQVLDATIDFVLVQVPNGRKVWVLYDDLSTKLLHDPLRNKHRAPHTHSSTGFVHCARLMPFFYNEVVTAAKLCAAPWHRLPEIEMRPVTLDWMGLEQDGPIIVPLPLTFARIMDEA